MNIVCSKCGTNWEVEINQIVPTCKCGDKCPECIGGNSEAYINNNGIQCSTGWTDCQHCHGLGRIAPEPKIDLMEKQFPIGESPDKKPE